VTCAAEELGVTPHEVAVIVSTGSGLRAAQASGAVGIVVASPLTLRGEMAQAPLVASSLSQAVDWVLRGVPGATAI
jgi:D-glycero-D-manno-heptose 1,7-bisphosphate phosphatase